MKTVQGIQGIHHVAVAVPDIDIARKFYIELLDFEEISGSEWEPGNKYIDDIVGLENTAGKAFIARAPNAYIEVFQYLAPEPGPQDPKRPVNECGYTHFCLQVEDIHATYQRMLDAGLTFHTEPAPIPVDENGNKNGMSATYGRDFFGNVFEIIEIHDGSSIAPL